MWSNAPSVSVACKFYSYDIYFSMSYIPWHSLFVSKRSVQNIPSISELLNVVIFMALVKECYMFFYLFALTNVCK
jgi:hypothetical protein